MLGLMANSMPWLRNSAAPAMFVHSSLPKIRLLAKRLYPWTKEGVFVLQSTGSTPSLFLYALSNLRDFPRNPLKKFKFRCRVKKPISGSPQHILKCLFLNHLFLLEGRQGDLWFGIPNCPDIKCFEWVYEPELKPLESYSGKRTGILFQMYKTIK